jgi:hypothetical protein
MLTQASHGVDGFGTGTSRPCCFCAAPKYEVVAHDRSGPKPALPGTHVRVFSWVPPAQARNRVARHPPLAAVPTPSVSDLPATAAFTGLDSLMSAFRSAIRKSLNVLFS